MTSRFAWSGSAAYGALMPIAAVWLALSPDADARPVALSEVLAEVAAHHPDARLAHAAADRAEGTRIRAAGLFDPTFDAAGNWRTAEEAGSVSGFPYVADVDAWGLTAGFNGQLTTGTLWSLTGGLDRNQSRYVTNLGLAESVQIEDLTTTRFDAALQQPLLRGLLLGAALGDLRGARLEATAAELQAESARQDALASTAAAYWNWAVAYEARMAAEELRATASADAQNAEALDAAGRLAPGDRARFAAALAFAEGAAMDTATSERLAAAAVFAAMGRPPESDARPATTPPAPAPVTVDATTVVAAALAQRPSLLAARSLHEAAEAELRASKGNGLPQVDLTAEAGVVEQRPSAGATTLAATGPLPYVGVGGLLSVPLGNREARGNTVRAHALVARRQAELDQLVVSTESDVLDAFARLTTAEARTRAADDAVRATVDARSAEEALFAAGRSTLRDVLWARQQAADARTAAVRARATWHGAATHLLALQGKLGDAAQVP